MPKFNLYATFAFWAERNNVHNFELVLQVLSPMLYKLLPQRSTVNSLLKE